MVVHAFNNRVPKDQLHKLKANKPQSNERAELCQSIGESQDLLQVPRDKRLHEDELSKQPIKFLVKFDGALKDLASRFAQKTTVKEHIKARLREVSKHD